MSKSAEIKKALIEALGANPNLPITAEVVSVQENTCTVKLVSELVLSDVRLCATISEDTDLFVLVPKIGSEVVLISQTGKLSGLMVIKVDAIQTIKYKKGTFEFIIDGTTGKVTLKKQGANFGGLINELIDAVSNAQIITPNGPGSINPTTINQLSQIKSKFNLILNTV
jgi:hypothetical protein